VFGAKSNGAIAASLVLTIFLWGANNVGVKYLIAGGWPPVFVGCARFLPAGLLLLAILRWTTWFGARSPLSAERRRALWRRGGLSLAVYIAAFNWAVHYTSASHVALYLGASPVWALLWEGKPERTWRSAQRYGAALLAASGVIALFWPKLRQGDSQFLGELLGLAASVLWTNYSRQCRAFGASLSGAEITAHTMLRGALWLLPPALMEIATRRVLWRAGDVAVFGYTVVGGGVVAFALWNNALRHWPTSQVFLFNNLIPLSTMVWASVCLREPVTPTFWLAMLLIVTGVVLGQTNWRKIVGARWLPFE